jgi:hypothetical protein
VRLRFHNVLRSSSWTPCCTAPSSACPIMYSGAGNMRPRQLGHGRGSTRSTSIHSAAGRHSARVVRQRRAPIREITRMGQGRQHQDDNGGAGPVYRGLAWLFWLLPSAPEANCSHSGSERYLSKRVSVGYRTSVEPYGGVGVSGDAAGSPVLLLLALCLSCSAITAPVGQRPWAPKWATTPSHRKKIGRHWPQGQTCSPSCDRLSV